MKHSVDSRQEKERPNLLSSSNRNSIPTIDILSGLENRQSLKGSTGFSRKKIWGVTLLVGATIVVIGLLQFDKLQNLSVNIAEFFSPSSAPNRNLAPITNASRLSQANKLSEAAATSIVDDVKETLEPTAILVDIPIEKEKTEVAKDSVSDSKIQPSSVKDTKQSHPAPARVIGSMNPNTTTKGKVTSQNITTKKHGIESENDAERKKKEALKMHTNTEKNPLKTYDNDIALLSALVANSPKSRDELSNNINNSTTVKKAVAPSINLDVVERNPGDNTKSLLSRCEKLGGAEAKLCHDRICSGSWQSESACLPTKG